MSRWGWSVDFDLQCISGKFRYCFILSSQLEKWRTGRSFRPLKCMRILGFRRLYLSGSVHQPHVPGRRYLSARYVSLVGFSRHYSGRNEPNDALEDTCWTKIDTFFEAPPWESINLMQYISLLNPSYWLLRWSFSFPIFPHRRLLTTSGVQKRWRLFYGCLSGLYHILKDCI